MTPVELAEYAAAVGRSFTVGSRPSLARLRAAITASLLLAALAGVITICSGCPKDDTPLKITLINVAFYSPLNYLEGPRLTAALANSRYTLRFSFYGHRSGKLGPVTIRRQQLRCFRVLKPTQIAKSSQDVTFLVPLQENERITLRVDAFSNTDGQLAFSGTAHNVDLTAPTLKVFMQPARGKTLNYQARHLRAFHSATVLPNGEVLFIGGLATKDGSAKLGDVAYANKTLESFDPSTLTWNTITAREAGLARAFHKALLLPSPEAGPYRILLLGGVMAAKLDEPLVARVARKASFQCDEGGECPFFFNVLPHEGAAKGEPAVLTYTPGPTPQITYQPLPSLAVSNGYFPQLALIDDNRALYVPGVSDYRAKSPNEHGFASVNNRAYWISLPASGNPTAKPADIVGLRAGHQVGMTNQGALIVGGLLDGDLAAQRERYALASGGEGSPFSTKAAPTGLFESAFGSLTPLGLTDRSLARAHGATDLLLVPGIPGQQTPAKDNANRRHVPQPMGTCGGGPCAPNEYCINNTCQALPPARVAFSVGSNSVQLLGTALGYPAVGYGAATRLADGSVLLSGGNLFTCNLPCAIHDHCPNQSTCEAGRCANPSQSNLCATDATAVLRAASSGNGLVREDVPALGQPRYGHTSVRLLDDTVLISGGLQLGKGGALQLVVETELYSQHTLTLEDIPQWIERNGQLLEPNTMADNDTSNAGLCRTPQEVGQQVNTVTTPRLSPEAQRSPTKTVTGPLPRTSNGRLMRAIRLSR